MGDEIAVLRLVCERLAEAGIGYMVSGSIAMNYYAQPRMTRDIDIVVALRPGDASGLAAALNPELYCDPDVVREAIRRQGMFNVIHETMVVKVDLVVRKDDPYRRTEFARRQRVRIDDFEIWIVTAEDLLLSKLHWAKDSHSELQLRDVRNLIRSVVDLDWSYVTEWAAHLGVEELLTEVRS